VMLGAGVLAPGKLFIAIEYFLALSFISWTVLRLVACLFPRQAKPSFDIPPDRLPIYTIIVPLYREAPVVAKLVRALRQLDYPGIRAQTPQTAPRTDRAFLKEVHSSRAPHF